VDIIDRLDSYTEVSVSGSGVHIICRGVVPQPGNRKGRIEMYDSKHYFVMTGAGATRAIEERTMALATLHGDVFGVTPESGKSGEICTGGDVPESVTGISDDHLLDRIRQSAQRGKFQTLWAGNATGYHSQSQADQALCNIFTFWTHGDGDRIDRLFRQSQRRREKWGRQDYRDCTIARALATVTERYSPNISTRRASRRQPRAARYRRGKRPHQNRTPQGWFVW
jgi:primase-polymerase (primpol)-like protein